MTLKEIHADAVAPAQRPHSPRGEERRSDREDDARELQPVSELDGERQDVGDHERKPYQGRVVLEPPCRPRSKQVPALSADDPQGGRREKDDVSGEEDSDAQRAIVHEAHSGGRGQSPPTVDSVRMFIHPSRRSLVVGGHFFIGRTARAPHHMGKERSTWLSSVSSQHSSASCSVSSSAPRCFRSPRSRRSAIRSSSSFFLRPHARSWDGSERPTSRSCRPASSSRASAPPRREISSAARSAPQSGSSSRSFSRSRSRSFPAR